MDEKVEKGRGRGVGGGGGGRVGLEGGGPHSVDHLSTHQLTISNRWVLVLH